MGKFQKGHKNSPETREKMRLSKIGTKASSKTRLKMSMSRKGKQYRLGTFHSDETKRKMSESHRGEKSPFWKGGVSRAYRSGYYSIEYKNWRKKVFARDNYTCQGEGCGKTGVYITAHHIKSFARFPKLRFVVSNGVTLCEDCHERTDNYKGRGKRNTK